MGSRIPAKLKNKADAFKQAVAHCCGELEDATRRYNVAVMQKNAGKAKLEAVKAGARDKFVEINSESIDNKDDWPYPAEWEGASVSSQWLLFRKTAFENMCSSTRTMKFVHGLRKSYTLRLEQPWAFVVLSAASLVSRASIQALFLGG